MSHLSPFDRQGDSLDTAQSLGKPLLSTSPAPNAPFVPTTRFSVLSMNAYAPSDIGDRYGSYEYDGRRHSVGTYLSDANTLSYEKAGMAASTSSLKPGFITDSTISAAAPVHAWHTTEPEEDDALHAPEEFGRARRGRLSKNTQPFIICSLRGWVNLGTLSLLILGILMLFIGYPIFLHFHKQPPKTSGFNIGGINATGQIPSLNFKTLVDPLTPEAAMTRVGTDGKTYNLIFSDEFEQDGRTFYPGDDPYWEAQDFHYWATGDMEWYDPDAVTTQDGKLVITMSRKDATRNHDLNFKSGMLTTWNKFCFTTGYVEVSASLPGSYDVPGLWPGIWTMGNLGRAGYGATTDGMWPYSYDSCDAGTFPRQMDKSGLPASSATDGWNGGYLSDLPGQRLSACTCPNSDHPGPKVTDGRSAPEIDIIEAQIDLGTMTGEVSQSFQIAPFNAFVRFDNSSPVTTIVDESITRLNSFTGTTLQQAVSAVTKVRPEVYNNNEYTTFGIEYRSDKKHRDAGYIQWYSQGTESWRITSGSIGPDPVSEVSQRLIPEEPMYLILNLGMSSGFTTVDLQHLQFPAKMYIDYVRVYQRGDVNEGVTCDPSHHPTKGYINSHLEAYTNWNRTTWDSAGYTLPRNSMYDGC